MSKEKIAKIIYDELSYMYCDNCRYAFEIDEDDPTWNCDECYRKYNCWGISMAKAEQIAEMIGGVEDDWTPVSKHLPTEDGEYLVQYIRGSMDVMPWAEGWNCFRDIDGTVVRRCEINSVVAWKPKPKPYKGE